MTEKKQFDPQMHSAEHILNQTMNRFFQCGRCFSAHIERKKSKCDYHFDRPLTDEEKERIEKEVNRIIGDNLPVSERFISFDAAAKQFDLSRLPTNAGDRLRIVDIGTYDSCPCIGPHVERTGDIGGFRITSSGFENGVLRVRFKLKRT